MANKQDRADNAVLMAILEDIKSLIYKSPENSVASTAVIAASDIKRDGADQNDIHRIVTNELLPPIDKIKNKFKEYPGITEKLNSVLPNKNFDPETINEHNVEALANLISYYLSNEHIDSFAEGGQFDTSDNWIEVQIGDKIYNLLVAKTDDEKEIGLMNVESMESNEGMLFDYSDEPQPEVSFWMKDTSIPLKICFVNEDGIIISVHDAEPFSEELITESSEFVAYVIEVNQGENIKAGDETSLGETDNPELEVNKLYVYGPDGDIQAELLGGERIFSRISSRVIIRKAKKAFLSKDDKDYKALGRYIFKEMDAQDNRKPQYTE